MTEYTPSLSEMQGAYEFDRMCTTDTNRKGARAEFDRAIAKIKADAWQEGYDEFERAHGMSNYEPWEYAQDNPYKEETK